MGGKIIAQKWYRDAKHEYLQRLKQYGKQRRLPSRFVDGKKTADGMWIENQLKSPPKDEQLLHEWKLFEKLFEDQLEIEYLDVYAGRWMEKLSELREFRENEGMEPSPRSDLGSWKARQQRNYDAKIGLFSNEHYRKLWSS